MNYEDVKMFCIAGLPNGKSSSVIPSGLCIGGFNFSETLTCMSWFRERFRRHFRSPISLVPDVGKL